MGEVDGRDTSPIVGRASPIADISPVSGEAQVPVTNPAPRPYSQVTLNLANGILTP
jgi:hypothetical protein